MSTVSWLTDFGAEAGLASAPVFHISQTFPWAVDFEQLESDSGCSDSGADRLQGDTAFAFEDVGSEGEEPSEGIRFDSPCDSVPELDDEPAGDMPNHDRPQGRSDVEIDLVVDWHLYRHVPGLLHMFTI